jgi:hypothetical protein
MNLTFSCHLTRLALVLMIPFALIVAILPRAFAALPFENDIRGLFGASESCSMPCWAGIRVGVTTRDQAEAILRAHPWVGTIFTTPAQLSWRWNGAQPAIIDGARDGLIGLGGGVVQRLRIQTTIPYGALWLALGAPDDALLVRPASRYAAFQISLYDPDSVGASLFGANAAESGEDAPRGGWTRMVLIIHSFGCPAAPRAFWGSTTTLGMGDVWTTEALNSIRFDVYNAAEWWRRTRVCRSGQAR